MNRRPDFGPVNSFCFDSRKAYPKSVPRNLMVDNLSDTEVSIQFQTSPSFELCGADNNVQVPMIIDGASAITALRPLSDLDSFQKDDEANFQHKDTLHSIVQSSLSGNQVLNLQDKSIRSSLFQQHENFGHSFLSFDKKFQGVTSANVSNNVVSQKPTSRSKSRIRWTQDLDNKFIDCVNRLGGAKKATPKGILKLMNCDGLTIFHVKSHLQKYRVSHNISESTEGKDEVGCTETPQFDATTGMQMVEALRLQLDVQKRLYEQLEIQKNLQVRIEEQAKQLQMMFECQLKTS